MKQYGNSYWQEATDNKDKTVAIMSDDVFQKIYQNIENSGLNYCAYSDGNTTAMVAVNSSELEYFKEVAGLDDTLCQLRKSNKEHIPQDKNVIGNTEYRYIPNKTYISEDRETVLKMAEIANRQNMPFSARIYANGKATMTISKADEERANAIKNNVIEMRSSAVQQKMRLLKETNICDYLKNIGYSQEQIDILKPAIATAAENDYLSIDNFINKDYSNAQLYQMSSMLQQYLSMSEQDILLDKNGFASSLFDLKKDFDIQLEVAGIVSLHDYSNEQKTAIESALRKGVSSFLLNQLDETFSVNDIEKYSNLVMTTDNASNVRDFLNNHKMNLLPFEDRYADEIEEMMTFLKSNEHILEFASHNDYNEYHYAFDDEFVNKILMMENNDFVNSFFNESSDLNRVLFNNIFGELKEKIFDETEKISVLTELEKAFLDSEIEPVMAKSVLAWDEIEDLGYIFFEEGYIDKYPASERAMYGNGADEKDIYVLADKMRNGEDIHTDLTRALLGNQQNFTTKQDNTFHVTYNKDDITATFGNAEKSISYKAVGEAFLNLFEGEYKEIVAAREEEKSKEINNTNGSFRIMQLSHSDEEPDKYHGIRFFSKDFNDSQGIQLNYNDYTQVYEGDLSNYPTNNVLDSIYESMNTGKKPDGYTGHSLSVSDVIVTNINGDEKAYYCDDFGFTEMPDFFREKEIVAEKSPIIENFKAETEKHFNNINGYTPQDIENSVRDFVISELYDNGIDAEIGEVIVSGSRCRGLENAESDIDVIVEIKGSDLKEDALFNILHEEGMNIDGIKIDINPIRPEETGTLENYLPTVETYLAEKTKVPVFENTQVKTVPVENVDNFIITDDSLGEGGAKTKFKNNLLAIETLKQIEAENRTATPEEQEIMSKYVGWGGLASAFDPENKSWANEFTQLKDIMTEKEYADARGSVLDSFFTAPAVIDGIYQALEKFGFKGGNILEPSCGTGNFIGKMPSEMAENSKIYGVEVDSITGRIAQQLYPNADIQVTGFENTRFQNGAFDVAIGNVPFGNLGFTDKEYNTTKLHDFFFAKSIDKVKEGGIIAFITSKGTLDKKDESFRKQLSEKAELIGAIRLPNNAFKANAGTEVTSDIIFLKKLSEPPKETPEWVHLKENADGLRVNSYFADNPEMALGKIVEGNKLYGRNDDTMCVPFEGADLKRLLSQSVKQLNAYISDKETTPVYQLSSKQVTISADELRPFSYFKDDKGDIFLKGGIDKLGKYSVQKHMDKANKDNNRLSAFIDMRDTTRELLKIQANDCPDNQIQFLQNKLSKQYDDFYKTYGLLHSKKNKSVLREDCSYNLLLTLEKEYDKDKLISKSDIFTKRTIKPSKAAEHVDTALEALTISIAETAKVDLEYMSKLTDMSPEKIVSDLKGEIFLVPGTDNTYQSASEYLSGDIRQKLDIAQSYAETDSRFAENVTALEKAMPEPLKAGDIEIKIGAAWIDTKLYEQFLYETLGTPRENRADIPNKFFWSKPKHITVDYSEHTGQFHIENKSADKSVTATRDFGTKKMNAYEIMESLLNLKDPKIYKTIEVPDGAGETKEKRVVDIEATKIAQQKANKLKNAFKDWIFKTLERAVPLVEQYNRQFNSVKPREYDGSALRFPGMNNSITLREHQKNAIAHALFGGNTLFAHVVGAGKTFEMIASVMESKRLGLCTKPLMAVPNHLTEQIGEDFQKLYPSANILVATKNDFIKGNRQQLFAKIATGDFDAVIIGHSQLGMIPLSKERQTNILNEQINDIIAGIEDLKKAEGSKFQVKQMERTKKSLEAKLDKLEKSHDDFLTFEEMGIDKLVVDELHEFKNVPTPTKLSNVAGISNSASQKALDLFMKVRYLDEKTGSKGFIGATGTPISNSVTELHTMMRFLEYDFLKDHGLANFDNWVSVFGNQKTEWELAPAGNRFKERTRISDYTGLPELMSMFKQVADVRTADTLNLPTPEMEYHIENVEATEFQKILVQELSDRADDVQGGNIDPSIDNMLRITSDGRKLGLDPRLIDASFEDNPNTKLNQCVRNVFQVYEDTKEEKSTQIIFCDLGVPKKNSQNVDEKNDDEKSAAERESLEEECDFCVYDDIRDKLIEKGVKPEEIAYIHDAKTEQQKTDLFDKVNKGEVRVLLGSTSKMGTGTNCQKKLIALHNLDIPWRPSDMQQRGGRIERQGNENSKAHIYNYVTKGSFDAYLYQTLESKQKFIGQIMTSKTPARKCEDVDQQALSYSEIKALCTGDERIKEKMMLENEVKELNLLKSEHTNAIFDMQQKVSVYPQKHEQLETTLNNLLADREILRQLPIDPETKLPEFKITIAGTEYTDRKEAAKAFEDTVMTFIKKSSDVVTDIGEFQGFKLSVSAVMLGLQPDISVTMENNAKHTCVLTSNFTANLKRMESTLYKIDQRIDDARNKISNLESDYKNAEKIANSPFPQQEALNTKTERLEKLTSDLNKAAAEAKKNKPQQERTCYFERAKLKREAFKNAPKSEQASEQAKDVKKQENII